MSYVNFLRKLSKLHFFLHLNPQIKTEIFIIFQILGMRDCHDCMCVTYCSEQHYENDIEKHKENFCQELKYSMVCDNYESTVCIAAPPVPSKLDSKFNELISMENHLKFISKKDSSSVDLAEMEFRFLSDRLTGPLTILYVGMYHAFSINMPFFLPVWILTNLQPR